MTQPDPPAAPLPAAAASWVAERVGLGGSNSLLWGGGPRGELDLTHAHPAGLAKLLSGRDTRVGELFREPSAQVAALQAAEVIHAKERELHAERGLPGAYLALGLASWSDRDARIPPSAPVFLRRCHLRPVDRAGEDFTVELTGDLVFNDVLADYLESVRGLSVPQEVLVRMCRRGNAFDPSQAYAALARLTTGIPGWRVTSRLVLSTFPVAKAAAVADVRRVAAAAAGHPVLARLIAAPPAVAPTFAPGPATDPDRIFVLDADAAQVAVLEDVRGGLPVVVVDAGPGTGKSQTAVNLIADAASRGERVLFVAEPEGARAAVIRRLSGLGLGGLVVEPGETVASGPTGRSDPAGERPVPVSGGSAVHPWVGGEPAPQPGGGLRSEPPSQLDDDARVESRRVAAAAALAAHVDRMHGPRAPWEVTLDEVQARMVELTPRGGPPRTRVRFSSDVLTSLGRADMSVWAERLATAAARGAWDARGSSQDPWFAAQIGDDRERAAAELALDALSDSGIRQLQSVFDDVFAGMALPVLPTLGHYRDLVDEMDEIKAVLDVFRVGIFDPDVGLGDPSAATARDRWRESRRLRSLLRPGSRPADLHAVADRARRVRPLWRIVRRSEIMPGEVLGSDRARAAYDRVGAQLAFLEARLVRPEGAPPFLDLPLGDLRAEIDRLTASRDRLAVLPSVTRDLNEARAAGFGALIDDLARRGVPAGEVGPDVEFAWWASILLSVTTADPGYAAFDGGELRGHAATFREADLRLQRRAARSVASRGPSCWVLSPLAVGWAPAADHFDLVVVDEAQSLTSARAASALARAQRAVIMGDSRQPGPSDFSYSPAESVVRRAESPSLLDEAARRWPVRSFPTHYRSHDARLISGVGSVAYPAGLQAFPSPAVASALTWKTVASEELAATVAADVVGLVRAHPGESVGVVTLDAAGAAGVVAELHAARAGLEIRGTLAGDGGQEAFFVRDAARVVGEVRDRVVAVIDQDAWTALRRGSDRDAVSRLTAALTRARAGMTVVTDVDPAQVDGHPAGPLLRAVEGCAASAPRPGDVKELPVLLDDLCRRLRARGLRVGPGVDGTSGVDLTVRDPFLRSVPTLAVEIDGRSYAAVPGVRSRERLRPEQLTRLGWHHLRVFSVDLFRDPAREEARIVATLERLARRHVAGAPPAGERAAAGSVATASREVTASAAGTGETASAPGDAVAAVEAAASDGSRTEEGLAASDAGRPAGGSGAPLPGPVSPRVRLEQTRDDTDEHWGERRDVDAHDRWLEENRPPHWG